MCKYHRTCNIQHAFLLPPDRTMEEEEEGGKDNGMKDNTHWWQVRYLSRLSLWARHLTLSPIICLVMDIWMMNVYVHVYCGNSAPAPAPYPSTTPQHHTTTPQHHSPAPHPSTTRPRGEGVDAVHHPYPPADTSQLVRLTTLPPQGKRKHLRQRKRTARYR